MTLEGALAHVAERLSALDRRFALVGGLAVSFRSEIRFTRDIDLAVHVVDDGDFERLTFDLRSAGYEPIATVEQKAAKRLSTVRLASPLGFVVDLLGASSGIEPEIVERATEGRLEVAGLVPIARPEELIATKVLSMTPRRLQDRLDALNLFQFTPEIDLAAIRENLRCIARRGYDRGQDLEAKLSALLGELGEEPM